MFREKYPARTNSISTSLYLFYCITLSIICSQAQEISYRARFIQSQTS